VPRQRVLSFALVVAFLVPGLVAPANIARANGIGDLYAAVDGGILELHVASSAIVQRVAIPGTPSGMAFSNDARSLYLASGRARLDRIDIESIQLADNIATEIDLVTVAIPKGGTAVTAGPGRPRLLLAGLVDGKVRETDRLPGAPDLLTADRRDPHALAARSGASWVSIVDVDDGSVAVIDVQGDVVGLAVDRAGAAGFVVTRSPDRLTRISLVDHAVLWEVPLPGPATAVVSTAFGPIVAGSGALWSIDGDTAIEWAGEGSPSGILAASDGGDIVYVGQASAVLAFDANAQLQRTIALPATERLRGLAAFPAPGSLSAAAGRAGNGSGIEPPATSTLPPWLVVWGATPALLAGALAVFATVLLLGLVVLRRRSGRRAGDGPGSE